MLCPYELAGAGPAALTPREREVLDYVAAGKSNKVIAIELGLSMRTVETHRARIFFKMGVRNAVELARRIYAPHTWDVPAAVLLEPGPHHAGPAAGAASCPAGGACPSGAACPWAREVPAGSRPGAMPVAEAGRQQRLLDEP